MKILTEEEVMQIKKREKKEKFKKDIKEWYMEFIIVPFVLAFWHFLALFLDFTYLDLFLFFVYTITSYSIIKLYEKISNLENTCEMLNKKLESSNKKGD